MSEPVSGEIVAEAVAEAPVPVPAPGAGALLRRLRESQGIHIAALAVALKVPVRQIEALESDRLDLLPDLTFARALTASLCRQLKADPQPVLDAMPQHAPRLGTAGREPINERFHPAGAVGSASWRELVARPPVAVALALLLGAVLLLVLPVLRDQLPATPEAAPAAVPEASPAGADPAAPGASGLVTESVSPALPAGGSGAGAAGPDPAAPAAPATATPLPALVPASR